MTLNELDAFMTNVGRSMAREQRAQYGRSLMDDIEDAVASVKKVAAVAMNTQTLNTVAKVSCLPMPEAQSAVSLFGVRVLLRESVPYGMVLVLTQEMIDEMLEAEESYRDEVIRRLEASHA